MHIRTEWQIKILDPHNLPKIAKGKTVEILDDQGFHFAYADGMVAAKEYINDHMSWTYPCDVSNVNSQWDINQ